MPRRSIVIPFGIMLAVTGHGAGWPFARGGSRAISSALVDILVGHGVRIETGAEVTSLDQLPEADATFLDVTPRQLLRIADQLGPDALYAGTSFRR